MTIVRRAPPLSELVSLRQVDGRSSNVAEAAPRGATCSPAHGA